MHGRGAPMGHPPRARGSVDLFLLRYDAEQQNTSCGVLQPFQANTRFFNRFKLKLVSSTVSS
eukprot:1177703-Prorocentrum_minimum.AAC.1